MSRYTSLAGSDCRGTQKLKSFWSQFRGYEKGDVMKVKGEGTQALSPSTVGWTFFYLLCYILEILR